MPRAAPSLSNEPSKPKGALANPFTRAVIVERPHPALESKSTPGGWSEAVTTRGTPEAFLPVVEDATAQPAPAFELEPLFVRPSEIKALHAPKMFIDPRWHPNRLVRGAEVGVFLTVDVVVDDLDEEELALFVDTVAFSSDRFNVKDVPMFRADYRKQDGKRTVRLTTEYFRHSLGSLDVAYTSVNQERHTIHLGGQSGGLTYQSYTGATLTASLPWCHVAPHGSMPLDQWLDAQQA